MNAFNLQFASHLRSSSQIFARTFLSIFIWTIFSAADVFAQRQYTIEKPRERSNTDRVFISTRPAQRSKGILAVVLSRYVNAEVVVMDANGNIIEKKDAGKTGQAEFQLQRGKVYKVEARHPGYLSASDKSRPLGTTEIIRLDIVPQFASLTLRNLPSGAQIFIDDKLRATTDQTGNATIGELAPGAHNVKIRHPEYNDYNDAISRIEAGDEIIYGRIPLRRVAKLAIRGPADAMIFIDGAMQGKVNADGTVQIDYDLENPGEHTITAELLGYQTWSKREALAPGPRMIAIKLDPIVTSTGVSDFFDALSLWNQPPSWKIAADPRNKKLEVRGDQLGTLSGRTYRDFHANFTIWLNDGKGASWAVRADKEGRNYYLFHLAGPNSTTHTPKRFYTYVVKDGGLPTEVSTPIPVLVDLNQQDSYTITISVSGYTIHHNIVANSLKVEESDLGIWTDTTTTKDKFLYGTFGFRSLSGEVFTVDDLNLEPVKEQ
jgi:hypothetical protein